MPRVLTRVVRGAWVLLSAGVLVACAATPPALPNTPAPPSPSASAPSTAAVASQIQVESPKGSLDQNQKEQALHQVVAQGGADAIKRQLAAMASFGDVGLYADNDAQLLIDGPATFKAMFAAIGQARRSILLESYIIEDTGLSQRLAALLAEKRAQGVQVLVLYDSLGSVSTSDAFFKALQDKGIATCAFNPMNPLKSSGELDLAHRDHRKILTVDREIGFTGGINISAVYASGSFGHKREVTGKTNGSGWRDTQIELRGSAAGALEDLISETWRQQKCEGTPPVAPTTKPAAGLAPGKQLLRIVASTPDDSVNHIYALMMSSIGAAKQSVYLTMAYFAPGDDMIDALCDAAGRGVDVQLILPSRSDFTPVLHAGRSHYARLLGAGVKIHELQDSVLHAKTMVIDGVVSTVGSSNMDSRSFVGNNEIDAVVIGEDFGEAMTRMFRADLKASKEITLQAWNSRSVFQRGKEFFARIFEGLW
ncbi:MAG TPA: phospholipase D-like domain-containing protein [Burkholderiaceae bacterium]